METAEDGIGRKRRRGLFGIYSVWGAYVHPGKDVQQRIEITEPEFSECSGLEMTSWDLVGEVRGIRGLYEDTQHLFIAGRKSKMTKEGALEIW